jgi:hypothetical protein
MDLNRPVIASRSVLAVACGLMLLCCQDESSDLVPGRGVVHTKESAQADPRRRPAAVVPVDAPCRIAHLEWRDRSAPPLLEGSDGETWLSSRVAGETKSGDPGWTLFLELAVSPATETPDIFHFGVRGFLKDLNQVPPPVLESAAAGEQSLSADCGEGWSGSSCRQTLWQGVLAEPLTKVMGELTFLCEVRRMNGAALTEALAQADAWQEAELARTAGELGDKTVAPALRKLLDSSDSRVQLRAIAALGRLQDEGAIPQLVRLTRGAEEKTIHAVMVALADIESAEARRYLETWAEHHPLLSMRELARGLLGE